MYVTPTVGSGGFFSLKDPFDGLMSPGERYICKAVRKLSEYYANNEDPKADIYDKYQLGDEAFDKHKVEDIGIACLQSEKGHWLYVPVSYILKYPDPNGIPYRALNLVVAMPAMPANIALDYVQDGIKNLVLEYLGVDSVIKPVETSRVVLVSTEKHRTTTQARQAKITANASDRGRYSKLMQDHQLALNRIAELEAYIVDKLNP